MEGAATGPENKGSLGFSGQRLRWLFFTDRVWACDLAFALVARGCGIRRVRD